MNVQGTIHIDLMRSDNRPVDEVLKDTIDVLETIASRAGIRIYIDAFSFEINDAEI